MHLHFVLDEAQYNELFAPLIAEARARRHLVTTGLRGPQRYDADAIIALQDIALRGCPRPRVFITHGLGLAKRGHLTLDTDLLLLPYQGQGIVDDQRGARGGMTVVRGLGSPKIDLLARRRREAPALRARMREIYGFDDRPIIGYCPTWRHDGTLHHPQRGHRLREAERALEQAFNVVTLPHSLEADPSEIEELVFRLSPEMSRTDHLVAFDAVVTDTSGIGFELCAIDMPMVLLDNPAEPDYLLALMLEKPVPIDYGPVCTLETMVAAVRSALARPEAHAARRAYWADMAFGPRDGRAAARCIDAICDFVVENRKRFAAHPGEPLLLHDYRRADLRRIQGRHDWEILPDAAWLRFEAGGGSAFYGPYQVLGEGHFTLEFDLEIKGEHPMALRVDTHGGKTVLAELPLSGRVQACLPFIVPAALAGQIFEFRLTKPPSASGMVALRQFKLQLVGLAPEVPQAPPAEEPTPAPAPRSIEILPDPLWEVVAELLRAHAMPHHRILSLPNFLGSLPHPEQLDDYTRCQGPYDWVVLHKGRTKELPVDFLRQVARDGQVVLANAVFLVFRLNPLPDERENGHARGLLAQLAEEPAEPQPGHDRDAALT